MPVNLKDIEQTDIFWEKNIFNICICIVNFCLIVSGREVGLGYPINIILRAKLSN